MRAIFILDKEWYSLKCALIIKTKKLHLKCEICILVEKVNFYKNEFKSINIVTQTHDGATAC